MTLNSRIAIVASLITIASLAYTQSASNAPAAPVSVSSIAELNQIIANLRHASESAQADLSHLRIEKWKADGNTKRQSQSDTESILRNLQNAMPAILTDLQNSPENLALTFKLYRNLDALYDVLTSVVESAGAFGSKDEFQALSNDLNMVDNTRHAFAERMDKLATSKESEIGELRVALQSARAAIPPKKTVVDDTEPDVKKPSPRKKPASKSSASKPSSATVPKPPAPQTQPQ